MQRNDDPFNPEYKKEKRFFRDSNRRKIAGMVLVIAIFIYGSREYIYGETTRIEIRNAWNERVDKITIESGENFYYIINSSPWKISLIMKSNIGFETNYNGQALISGQVFNCLIWSNETGVVNVEWKKD